MDPLSHALLGAASGLAATRSHPRAAALAGAAGALLPDADVFIASSGDPLLTLEYHRHFSHSLFVSPVVALLAAAMVWLVLRRRPPYSVLYRAALVGVVSAIVLDACTSYGVHMLWPFREGRYAWSIVAVVDPVMTSILLAGVWMAIRADSARRARITVLLAAAYLSTGWMQHERAAAAVVRAADERGHAVARIEVKPTLGNLLLWRSIYQTGDGFVVDAVRIGWFTGPLLYPGGKLPRIEPGDLAASLPGNSVQSSDVERFYRQSEQFLVRHPENEDVLGDIRYAMLPDSLKPLWGIKLDPANPGRHAEFITMRQFSREDRAKFIAMLLGRVPDR